MVNKLLLYKRKETAELLDVKGEQAEELLRELGFDFTEWPEDLDIYNQEPGLWIWEGEINRDSQFNGKLRRINDEEQLSFAHKGRI